MKLLYWKAFVASESWLDWCSPNAWHRLGVLEKHPFTSSLCLQASSALSVSWEHGRCWKHRADIVFVQCSAHNSCMQPSLIPWSGDKKEQSWP